MILRRRSSFFLGSLVVTACVIVACSSSTSSTPSGSGDDSGTDTGPRVVVPKDTGTGDDDSGQTPEQCIAACGTAYPSGVTLDDKITSCWAANCDGPCVTGASESFDAGPDAGDGGDAGALTCGTGDPDTGDTGCNTCTATWCCAAWDGCFNDTNCSAYETCLNACPQN